MKKVLVTGAAGSIGLCVIKYLLSEGKYEITALDLANKKTYGALKKYHKRIKVIYGDILDRNLIDELVKEQDYIIHLATCLPPFSEINKDVSDLIDCNGTENIVRAINYYNKKCYLIYGSSTSVYNTDKPVSVDAKVTINEYDYYDKAKRNAEKYIMANLKHYSILRTSLVLGDLNKDAFIYNINKNKYIECISKEDAAYAFVKAIDVSEKINKQILNIGGGDTCTIQYQELLKSILRYYGISWHFVLTRCFLPKTYDSPVLIDSDKSNKLLNYQNDSLDSILMKIKRRSKKRVFRIFMGKIISKFTKDSK